MSTQGLSLETPNDFPAFPYQPPYSIQTSLMKHLYEVIERRQVTIVESPTGTGKTLSLLCSSLTWLADEAQRARIGKLDAASGQQASDGPDWVWEQTRARMSRDLDAEEEEQAQRLLKARKREAQMKRAAKGRVHKKAKQNGADKASVDEDEKTFLPDDAQDEDDNFSPAVRALMAKLNQGSKSVQVPVEDPTCTKIYYASRTHSQLSQVLPELRKLNITTKSYHPEDITPSNTKRKASHDEDEQLNEETLSFRTVSLGSRKQLCINEKLRNRASDLDEGCRELLAEKGDKRCAHLPSMEEDYRMTDLRDQILATPKDIEDLAELGKISQTCPYFGSRRAIPQAQLVTLPYNLLLQKSARDALGIDLEGQIVIVDEAHNLINTVLSLSTTRVRLSVLSTSLVQVCIYFQRFRNRLTPIHVLHLKKLIAFFDLLKKWMTGWKEEHAKASQSVEVVTSTDLMIRLGPKAAALNLLEIVDYLKSSKIARKISGYADKETEKAKDDNKVKRASRGAVPPLHAVEDFMLSLSSASEDGRLTVQFVPTKSGGDVEIKYQLLNAAPTFLEVVDKARSVILAGGTMSPISDVVNQLFTTVPDARLTSYSCGHIIPPSNLLTASLSKGPRNGAFDFKASKQNDAQTISELGQTISNLTNVIPRGMVVFFPSYAFLGKCKEVWKLDAMLDRFETKKKVFFEPEESTAVEKVLREYGEKIRDMASPHNGGALLFAVIGAKLSEGLNFTDDLARAVVIIGLPFANLGSPELKERMNYMKRLGAKVQQPDGKKVDAASELYLNMCMNSVNQSIGRAIRHRGDWAALILLDQRYSTPNIRNRLPKWIGTDLKTMDTFGQAMKELGAFYRGKRTSTAPS